MIKGALKFDFPVETLVLILEQHLAPRVLQMQRSSSQVMSVFRNILAGCKSSKALTALYLKRGMESIVNDIESNKANLDLFVDDTAPQAIARDFPKLREKIMPAMIKFQKV